MFGKRHTGRPLCSDPMIQHIILPQIGLSQKQIKKCHTGEQLCLGNGRHVDHCVHGRPRETTPKRQENHWFPFAPGWLKVPSSKPFQNHVKYYPRSMTFELFLPDLDQSILNALDGWVSIGATSNTMIQHIILPQICLPQEHISNMPYRETNVFGTHHTGRPLCSDPMIQNIILPQIGLAHDRIQTNAIQEDHCVWIP